MVVSALQILSDVINGVSCLLLSSDVFTDVRPIYLCNALTDDDLFCFNKVFKNLQLFMKNKQGGDDLFDRLNVSMSLAQSHRGGGSD